MGGWAARKALRVVEHVEQGNGVSEGGVGGAWMICYIGGPQTGIPIGCLGITWEVAKDGNSQIEGGDRLNLCLTSFPQSTFTRFYQPEKKF